MLKLLPQCCTSSSSKLLLLQHFKRNRSEFRPVAAKKSDTGENSPTDEASFFNLRISRSLVAKSAIAVFGLGFLDAGYSGDWSRVGAISKEAEEVLRIAAYLVVPLCFLLAFLISDEEKNL